MNAVTASFTDYKVADISLADYGRKEIKLAEAEMPALWAYVSVMLLQNHLLVQKSLVVST